MLLWVYYAGHGANIKTQENAGTHIQLNEDSKEKYLLNLENELNEVSSKAKGKVFVFGILDCTRETIDIRENEEPQDPKEED